MSILDNSLRVGNFTSSEIYKLMTKAKDGSFGKPALEYIAEKNMERRLGRALHAETEAKATQWGNLVESRVFDVLGLQYQLTSQATIQHPAIPYWCGSPDGVHNEKDKTVYDIKCPYTLKSFCELVDSKEIDAIRENHKDGEKYYWQLVSNAILTGAEFAELIVYVPYRSELPAIRELAQVNGVRGVEYLGDDQIPYIPDGGHYTNLNIIPFSVSEEAVLELSTRVLEAVELLVIPAEVKP